MKVIKEWFLIFLIALAVLLSYPLTIFYLAWQMAGTNVSKIRKYSEVWSEKIKAEINK